MSKTIKRHPAVYECDPGESLGGEAKYDVLLKSGWHFSDLDEMPDDTPVGHPNLRREARFETVKEFFDAKPRRLKDKNGNPVAEGV
ncbi:hypothetical protein [Acinetobacter phage ABPH49]|nr:hypothetical protein [Acinetobacter phage ABPH49]